MSRGSPGRKRAQELRAVADLPAAGQQVAAERELPPLPGRQRRGDIAARGREFLGQGPPVGGGLGRPGRGVRADRERRVADEADPAEHHPGHLDVVDHLHEGLGCADHAPRRSAPASWSRAACRIPVTAASVAAPGGSGHGAAYPVPAGHQGVQRRALADVDVPDDVDQAVALGQRAVQGGDRVDEDVAVWQHLVGERVAEDLAGAGGEVVLGHGAAPGHVPGVGRADRGQQPGPGGRADPVGADQQVGLGLLASVLARARPGPRVTVTVPSRSANPVTSVPSW